MKKLTLNAEDLAVESFEAVSDAGTRGTVHGRDDGTWGASEPSCCRTCEGDPTCWTINCC